MKKLLAIAVAATLAAPAAMAETTLYGKLSASVGTVEVNGADSKTTVESHASRFGIKGSSELDNGLSATYGLEYGVDLDGDNAAGSTGTVGASGLTTRNQFVGLKGSFGEVRVGKHDTPHKLATAGLDNFADTYGDSGVNGVLTERRVNNAVAYINKFGPVGVAVAHATNPVGTDDNGNALSSQNKANSLMLNYSNSGLYAGLGYETVAHAAADGGTGKNAKLGVGYNWQSGHNVNAVYEKDEDVLALTGSNTADNGEGKAYLVGGGVKVGAVKLKAQYGEKDYDDAALNDFKVTSLGADYLLGKKTTAYILGHQKDVDNGDAGDYKATVVGLQTEF